MSIRLGYRAKELKYLKNFILEISEEIRYSGANIETIKSKILSKEDYSFLENMRFTNESDKNEYETFIKGLGKSDVFGQIKYCEYFSKKIEERYRAVFEKNQEMGKIYCVLGICGGLTLALIII